MSAHGQFVRQWDVDVCRTSYGGRTLRVDAANWEDAQEVALAVAGNYEFNETGSGYEVLDCRAVH